MKTIATKHFQLGLFGCCVVSVLLTGCVGQVDSDVIVDPGYIGSDDYIYYPGYEVYYAQHSHRYYRRDGDKWMASRAPIVAPEKELKASPSVNMQFHDNPATHHTEVIQSYPRTWHPPQTPRPEPPRKNNHDAAH